MVLSFFNAIKLPQPAGKKLCTTGTREPSPDTWEAYISTAVGLDRRLRISCTTCFVLQVTATSIDGLLHHCVAAAHLEEEEHNVILKILAL